MLDFSRERPPKFTVVNVNELIEKTIGLLNHQLHSLNIETRMNLASYLPTVEGDASQIQQILFNLITTARQAMEASDVKDKTLHIGTDTAFLPTDIFSRPHIVITISDNGRGVPQHALPNVFNPFYTANEEGGTGLGVVISHRIVQGHLGLLTIGNNENGGAKATVRLPLSQS